MMCLPMINLVCHCTEMTHSYSPPSDWWNYTFYMKRFCEYYSILFIELCVCFFLRLRKCNNTAIRNVHVMRNITPFKFLSFLAMQKHLFRFFITHNQLLINPIKCVCHHLCNTCTNLLFFSITKQKPHFQEDIDQRTYELWNLGRYRRWQKPRWGFKKHESRTSRIMDYSL